MPPQDGWQWGTVKTLLNRLLNKGTVKAERECRCWFCEPQIEPAQWEGAQSLGLLAVALLRRPLRPLARLSQAYALWLLPLDFEKRFTPQERAWVLAHEAAQARPA